MSKEFYDKWVSSPVPAASEVKDLRLRRNLTAYEMSDKTGFHKSNIRDWESGEHKMSSGDWQRMQDIFRVTNSKVEVAGSGSLPKGTSLAKLFRVLRDSSTIPLAPVKNKRVR